MKGTAQPPALVCTWQRKKEATAIACLEEMLHHYSFGNSEPNFAESFEGPHRFLTPLTRECWFDSSISSGWGPQAPTGPGSLVLNQSDLIMSLAWISCWQVLGRFTAWGPEGLPGSCRFTGCAIFQDSTAPLRNANLAKRAEQVTGSYLDPRDKLHVLLITIKLLCRLAESSAPAVGCFLKVSSLLDSQTCGTRV